MRVGTKHQRRLSFWAGSGLLFVSYAKQRQFVQRNLTNCGGVTCGVLSSPPGEVEILVAASCYTNWDKVRQL